MMSVFIYRVAKSAARENVIEMIKLSYIMKLPFGLVLTHVAGLKQACVGSKYLTWINANCKVIAFSEMNTFNFVLISIYVQNILHAVKGFMLRMIINQVHRDFYFGYSTQLVCVFLKQSSLKPI